MIRIFLIAISLIAFTPCVMAHSSHHRRVAVQHDPLCNIIMPCDFSTPSTLSERQETRGRYVARSLGIGGPRHVRPEVSNFDAPLNAISRPARFIGGRLVCAINVNAELAARGVKGTGSALAHSFDSWGHRSSPQVGAVAVTDRRGGGHVAIVSRVEGHRVFAWSPSGRTGWREVEYTDRNARYRTAG